MRRKIISVLLLICLLAQCLAFAAAEEDILIIEYNGGGVVERIMSPAMARALVSELNVAYIESEAPFLTIGEENTWTVYAMGGDGLYNYQFAIFYREGTTGTFSGKIAQSYSPDNTFSYTIDKAGHYLLQIWLKDSSGDQSILYQSQIFETATDADHGNADTVAGKVKELAAQCRAEAGKSDYARALWLHDWLIYNAEYDHDYAEYYSDGVLLKGEGVCQSYALAYQMLLRELGIECIYITGYGVSGGENIPHGWNLVKLGGHWYHVDCTWDDPSVEGVTGMVSGYENHDYFGLTDEQMAKNHIWPMSDTWDPDAEWDYMPDCYATEYNYMLRSGSYMIENAQALELAFNEMCSMKKPYAHFLYTGTDASFSMGNELVAMLAAAQNSGDLSAYFCDGTTVSLDVAVGYDGQNASVISAPLELNLFTDRVLVDAGDVHYFDLEYMPKRALTEIVDNGDGTGSLVWGDVSFDASRVVWTSSDTDVATVQNGELTAIAPGTARITAACGDISTSCEVKVFVAGENSLVIPADMTEIRENAFLNCASISSVVIPYGTAAAIGKNAFDGCDNLRSIKIPATVLSIDDLAFGGETFTTIICEKGSAAHTFAVDNGLPFELG